MKKVEFTEKEKDENSKDNYWDHDGNMDTEPSTVEDEFKKQCDLGSECAGQNAAFVSADLLPKSNDKNEIVPDLTGMQLLDPEEYVGIDTVSSTLRNANLTLRADPPNPKTIVSPWLNSTIDPDPYRKTLDGC